MGPNRLRPRLAAVVAAALVFGPAGCDRKVTQATPVNAETVRIAFPDAMDSLDPLMYMDSRVLMLCIYESLTQIMPDGSLAPQLAQSWRSNEDATVWTFKIRANSKWSDGAPVTIDDVVFSFETIRNSPRSPNKPYLDAVKSIEKASDDEIRFVLKQPFATWPRQMELIPVAPRKPYLAMGGPGFSDHPIGSGPYKVVGWRPGAELDLEANPDYWAGAPAIKKVAFMHVTDSVARFNGLQSGDLDVIALTPQQVHLARKMPGIAVETAAGNKVVYLGFNTQAPMLGDSRVRHAIDFAIDREAIAKYLLRGLAIPTSEPVAKVTFGYDPSVSTTPYDPAKAKALLKEAGYSGEPIVFQYPTDGQVPLSNQVAQAIEGYLEAVGINVRMAGIDFKTLAPNWHQKKLRGMYMLLYNPSTVDAGMVSGHFFGPDGLQYFSDKTMEALEVDERGQGDESKRKAVLGEIWRENKEKAYYLPLFNDTNTIATVKSKVLFPPRADGYIVAQSLRAPEAISAR